MQDVLIRGRKANNGSFYIHTGDLRWWLYYPPFEGDLWQQIHLWDDPGQPGRLLGWALISPSWVSIDVYVQPELRGNQMAHEMYLWAEEQATRIAHAGDHKTISALWVRRDDPVLVEHFHSREFRLRTGMVHLTRKIDEEPIDPMIPQGFCVRSCKGELEVTVRARAQYGAFKSLAPFEQYEGRFTNFMRSPVYQPELDIVAVAPDGQIGAYCMVWTDLVNKVGLFEPVGTHPQFQHQGLGRAVVLWGLHKLKEYGMTSAIVSAYEDNLAGIKLYQSVGFELVFHLGTYAKDV